MRVLPISTQFFDRYYWEIENPCTECEETLGEVMKLDGDFKNQLAWFFFEETTYRIAQELELDL